MPVKKLKLQELKNKLPKMYATEAAKHFGVSYRTIKDIAAQHNIKFKKYRPAGRKKIELI